MFFLGVEVVLVLEVEAGLDEVEAGLTVLELDEVAEDLTVLAGVLALAREMELPVPAACRL